MTPVPRPDRSWIREMWAFLGNNENMVVDPLWDVDMHFRDLALNGTTDELVAELDAAIAAERDGEIPWEELSLEGEATWPADGPAGTAEELRGIRHRALAVRENPARVPPGPVAGWDGVYPPRESWFADEATEVAVRNLLWDNNAELIDAFGRGETGWARLHLFADLSVNGAVGWARDLPRSGKRHDYQPADPYPVSGAALLVRLDDDGVPCPARAHPELSLDASVRDSFPALCHFWGGFFHPHAGYPIWNAVRAMNATEQPAFDRVRDDLDRLLAEDPDDDRCRAVAEACGSYVLPQHARHWIDLLRWRFDGYDWGKGGT